MDVSHQSQGSELRKQRKPRCDALNRFANLLYMLCIAFAAIGRQLQIPDLRRIDPYDPAVRGIYSLEIRSLPDRRRHKEFAFGRYLAFAVDAGNPTFDGCGRV